MPSCAKCGASFESTSCPNCGALAPLPSGFKVELAKWTGASLELAGLKSFASRELRGKPVLRSLLLSERDRLAPEEFLAKMEIWLRLLDFEVVEK